MKKVSIQTSLLITTVVFSFAVASPIAAAAQSARATEAQPNTQEKQTIAHDQADDKKQIVQPHLEDSKLKACQNREKAITNIMARVADRGQKQVELFGKIAERTETFYADKGKTLSNYDALVAEVTAKKQAAQAAVDATKATSVEFKCDGTDPKGLASTFKDQMKAQNEALKAYKTAVKNLIVGVKSVQSTTSSDKSSTGGDH